MKKVVALVLALIIVLSCLMLTACGKKKERSSEDHRSGSDNDP